MTENHNRTDTDRNAPWIPRRPRGDGGLRWSERRQRWIAEITVGYTPAGKRIVRSASDKEKTRALKKLHKKLRDREDGLPGENARYTVEQAVRDWLEYGLAGRDEGTVTKNRIFAEKHIIPDLGRASSRICRPMTWTAGSRRKRRRSAPTPSGSSGRS